MCVYNIDESIVFLMFWNIERWTTMVLQPTVNETIALLIVNDHKFDGTIGFSTFYFQPPAQSTKPSSQQLFGTPNPKPKP